MNQLPFQHSSSLNFKQDLFPSTYACSTSFQHSFSEDLHNTSYETNSSETTRMMLESKASKRLKKDNLGDRFIPMRNSRRMEVGSYILSSQEVSMCEEEDSSYSKLITEGLIKAPLENDENRDPRINQFRQQQQSHTPSLLQNQLSFIYDKAFKNNEGVKKTSRIVNQNPEKVLDAPELINDYYLNLLDWGNNNVLAICLNQVVYLWNSSNSEIEQIQPVNEPDSYVSSVSWSTNNNVIGVGTSNGTVQIWDAERSRVVRTLDGHSQRVSSLSWNSFILSSGSKDSTIINHDLRMPDHIYQRHTLHTSEVCSLKWSPDGSQLASGANDNTLMIWDLVSNTPQHVLREHTAAVKALAWCPWQKNLLASGGGTNDKTIKFWNTDAGTMTQSVNANTQVCSLIWNPHEKEILSSHGFTNVAESDSKSYIQLWKYPTMNVVGELRGHDDRVLHMALSPNGETVVSAGADERLCFWKMFEAPQVDKKSVKSKMFNSDFR